MHLPQTPTAVDPFGSSLHILYLEEVDIGAEDNDISLVLPLDMASLILSGLTFSLKTFGSLEATIVFLIDLLFLNSLSVTYS